MTDGHRQGWTQYFDTRWQPSTWGCPPRHSRSCGGREAVRHTTGWVGFATFKMTWTSGVNLVAARAPAIPGRDDQRQSD